MISLGLIFLITSADVTATHSGSAESPIRAIRSKLPDWNGYIELDPSHARVRRHRVAAAGTRPDSLWMRQMRDSAGRHLIPNWIGTLHEGGADEPSFHEQWALSNTGKTIDGEIGIVGADVGAIDAWTRTAGDSSVVVAFLDGGIDLRHPDFKGKLAHNEMERNGVPGKDDDNNGYVDDTLGWDFIANDAVARDLGGHGSATASIVVGAWDGNGMAGLAPGVRVLPIRVADGGARIELADLVDGMNYAIKRKAKIINLSLGGLEGASGIDSAIARAVRSGAVVVASAGNEGYDLDKTPRYPASLVMKGLLVVGASTMRDSMSDYSNRSKKTVSLSAPGDAIFAATIPRGDTIWTETFESALVGWTTGGNSTVNWGTETKSGNTWLSDSPNRNYANAARSWIRSPLLNAEHRSSLVLSMSVRGGLNTADALMVESAPDTLFSTGVDTIFKYGAFYQNDPVGVGMDVGQDGKDLYLRFTLVSAKPSATNDSGVMIDSLVLRSRDVPQPPAGTYARVWGTSFSSPLVTGALALLASKNPDASPDSLVSAILGGAKVLPGLASASKSGARLWIPGAFLRMETTTKAMVSAIPERGAVAVRGGFRILEKGEWTLEWRNLQGRLVARERGVGEQTLKTVAQNGALTWRLQAPDRSFSGMILKP